MKNKDHHQAHGKAHESDKNQAPATAAAGGGEPLAFTAPAAETSTPAPSATLSAEQLRIQELEAQVADLKDKWMRSRADLDNYRKRALREQQEIRYAEKTTAVMAFLEVIDQFEMASEHFNKATDVKTLKAGMDLIQNEFRRALTALGVVPVEAAGKPFDPNLHQAVMHEASESVPSGEVLRQWKSGYRLGERLLRPASVVVSSGPAATPPPATAAPTPAPTN